MEVKANLVASWDDLKNPGDFIWSYSYNEPRRIVGLVEMCPCGCGDCGGIRFNTGEPDQPHPRWDWDRNEEEPTLTPSIERTGGCKWHGFLTKGIWRSV